jgi:hypothetical protein
VSVSFADASFRRRHVEWVNKHHNYVIRNNKRQFCVSCDNVSLTPCAVLVLGLCNVEETNMLDDEDKASGGNSLDLF